MGLAWGPISNVVGGDVAQLGERLVRNEEVGGSTPLISTKLYHAAALAAAGRARLPAFPAKPPGPHAFTHSPGPDALTHSHRMSRLTSKAL